MNKTLKVTGMSCGHCEARATKELNKIEGVSVIEASSAQDKIIISIEGNVSDEVIREAIDEAGYNLESIE